MKGLSKYLFMVIFWHISLYAFSATYLYELYLHNEYYSEPPGFPNKIVVAPIISLFSGNGDQWDENRISGGLVETVRFVHDHTWIELIAAFGEERVTYNHEGKEGKQSRFGWDDFLIDIGHNFIDKSGKKQLLIHWLIGIPLKKGITLAELEQPLWGTRTYATGPVIDIAYDFIRNNAEDLFVGLIGRFLHRFKRTYEPILPANAFLNPGNLMNLLALIHYRYYSHNIEAGYVYTLYNRISYQFVDHKEFFPSEKYNNFYIDYFYFYEKLSLGFEIGVVKTFGKPYNGTSIFGLVAWYF